jgi:retinol dehydrogenase-12
LQTPASVSSRHARTLAARGARVLIACRSPARAAEAVARIHAATGQHVSVLPLDLGDLESVRRCAAAFLTLDLPLHMLINNAGVAGHRGLTRSGFEMTFGINHVGRFLLTQLLIDRLKQSAPARVVTVASSGYAAAPGIRFDAARKRTRLLGIREYMASKLANVLFSAELARVLSGTGVTTYSLPSGRGLHRHLAQASEATTAPPAPGRDPRRRSRGSHHAALRDGPGARA